MFGLKTRSAALVASVATVSFAIATPAPAGATTFPYHQPNVVDCSQGVVRAYAPKSMTSWYGGPETVMWSSTLFRYNGSAGWQPYDDKMPWLSGVADQLGLRDIGYWMIDPYGNSYHATYRWKDVNGNYAIYQTYSNLGPGYYAIKNFYYWSSTGLQTQDVATVYNNAVANFCKI